MKYLKHKIHASMEKLGMDVDDHLWWIARSVSLYLTHGAHLTEEVSISQVFDRTVAGRIHECCGVA